MIRRTRTRFAALTAAALAALAVGSQMATAAPNPANQSGGAPGVVPAVVQVQNTLNNLQVLSNNGNVEIVTVKDSLNNVLQNARFLNNITVLQNFLNGPAPSLAASRSRTCSTTTTSTSAAWSRSAS